MDNFGSSSVSYVFLHRKLISASAFHFLAVVRSLAENTDFRIRKTPLLKCALDFINLSQEVNYFSTRILNCF